MIEAGRCRNLINKDVRRLRQLFQWGVSKQLVAVSVVESLRTVAGLRRGRSAAKETEPVKPVSDADIDATLPHLPDAVRAMVQFQRLTSCRPVEVRILRPGDVNTDVDVWVYRPKSHKTEHHGRERRIYIGPKAQMMLRPWLLRPAEAYCFSPRESAKSEVSTYGAAAEPARGFHHPRPSRRRDHYSKDAYGRAILSSRIAFCSGFKSTASICSTPHST